MSTWPACSRKPSISVHWPLFNCVLKPRHCTALCRAMARCWPIVPRNGPTLGRVKYRSWMVPSVFGSLIALPRYHRNTIVSTSLDRFIKVLFKSPFELVLYVCFRSLASVSTESECFEGPVGSARLVNATLCTQVTLYPLSPSVR